MSRIGKKELIIPEGVTVNLEKGVFSVKGPKGDIKRNFDENIIKIIIEDGKIVSEPIRNNKLAKALWGTYMSHIENMLLGAQNLFEKKLLIEGVGFKWEVKGDNLQLNVGFSHPVFVIIPKETVVVAEKGTLTISGIDKEVVSRFAMQVRKIKKGEPYKGKGIRYVDEILRRKQGKKSA